MAAGWDRLGAGGSAELSWLLEAGGGFDPQLVAAYDLGVFRARNQAIADILPE